jgi:hypothetical protein
VDVYNGGGQQGLAAEVSTALVKQGFKAGIVQNATTNVATSEVLYGTGAAASAARIAAQYDATATASSAVAAGHVQVILGANATATGGSATPTPTNSVVPIPTTGAQGGAVTAKNGIPCVD